MRVLNWFFNKMTGVNGGNWLSVRYHRWLYSKQGEINKRYLLFNSETNEFFKVEGAGDIAVSKRADHICGNAAGFGVSVSWSSTGLGVGGVIGIREARRLAEFIINATSSDVGVEEKILDEFKNRYLHI